MKNSSDFAILDHLMEGCQIIDFDFRYLYVNEMAAKHGEKSKEELLGRTMMEVYPGIEKTSMFSVLRKCLVKRKPAELENEFTYEDGSTAWFLLKMEPVPEGLFILSIDITLRKRAEIDLQEQLRRLEAFREIDLAIINITNLELVLKTILEKVRSTLSMDAVDVLLLNPDSNVLEFASGCGFRTKNIKKTQIRVGQGHGGRAALEQKTVVTPDLTQPREPFLRESLIKGEDFIFYCATPLIMKGNLVGVLEVFRRTQFNPNKNWLDFLETIASQASIAIESSRLFHSLHRSKMELMLAYDMTLEGWSKALDLRDKETEGHTKRVTEMTVRLARRAGILENELVHIRRGAVLHDIGKMGVPDAILLKPGKLKDDEWDIMRKHPVFAYEWLYPIEYLRPALAIPYSHHEKWDGTGYPLGLKGEQIPLPARLFAVVDVWDALSSDRPYRPAWPREKVIQYILEQAGTHFDPQAVEWFLQILNEK